MFEYVCEHVIPGCTSKERGDTTEAVREKAQAHLHSHHDMEYLDADLWRKVDQAIVLLRQAQKLGPTEKEAADIAELLVRYERRANEKKAPQKKARDNADRARRPEEPEAPPQLEAEAKPLDLNALGRGVRVADAANNLRLVPGATLIRTRPAVVVDLKAEAGKPGGCSILVEGRAVANTVFDRSPLWETLRGPVGDNPQSVMGELRRRGLTHLAVNEVELARLLWTYPAAEAFDDPAFMPVRSQPVEGSFNPALLEFRRYYPPFYCRGAGAPSSGTDERLDRFLAHARAEGLVWEEALGAARLWVARIAP